MWKLATWNKNNNKKKNLQIWFRECLRNGIKEARWRWTTNMLITCVCVCVYALCVWFTQEASSLAFLHWILSFISALQSLPLSYQTSVSALSLSTCFISLHSPRRPALCLCEASPYWSTSSLLLLLGVCHSSMAVFKKKKRKHNAEVVDQPKAPLLQWTQPVAWPQRGGRWGRLAGWQSWTPRYPAGGKDEIHYHHDFTNL